MTEKHTIEELEELLESSKKLIKEIKKLLERRENNDNV